jgi:hypothetical protein
MSPFTGEMIPVNDQNSPSAEKASSNGYKFSTLYQQQRISLERKTKRITTSNESNENNAMSLEKNQHENQIVQ